MRTFKILGALLTYPDERLVAASDELRAALVAEGLVPEPARSRVLALIDELGTVDPMELQERYVLLFDRSRKLSLHLFEHVHGDSRDRGEAMISLAQLYHAHGLYLDTTELPDYLPLFLEFLSMRPLAEAREHLGHAAHLIVALGERLERRDSPHAAVLRALEALIELPADAPEIRRAIAAEEPDDSFEALDAAWEEQPVTFGPENDPQGGCSQAATILSRLGREARTPPRPTS
jgi:nitrate reductase molybdenum cofactor assembly chaperone NarJ/NarW